MTTLAIYSTRNLSLSYIAGTCPYNAGEGKRVHPGGACPFQGAGAGVQRRPRREHVIHDENIAAPYLRHLSGRHTECAQDIPTPGLSRRHFALTWSRALAFQETRILRPAAQTRDALRQNRRLIIAPFPQPPAMQRHRSDHVRLSQQRASGAFQPACEGRRPVEAVAMLETEY